MNDDPLWKKLAEELRDPNPKRAQLEQIRDRLPGLGGNDLAAELLGEMASSLGKAERKINAALEDVARLGQAIDKLEAENAQKHYVEIRAKIAAFNEARKRAEQAVWELRVQREALGFRRNNDLTTLYPIPPRR